MIIIRKVEKKDINDIFECSNDDEVRKFSINKNKITWKEHEIWFNSVLYDPNVYFYVIEEDNVFLGQVRFIKYSEKIYTISISLNSKIRGKGYGKEILKKTINVFLKENLNAEEIIAFILPENKISQIIFEKNNFKLFGEEQIKNITVLKYVLLRGDFFGN